MQNQQEEQAQFYHEESKNLRDNYNKALRGEESENAERTRAQWILYGSLIVYSILLIAFVLLLYHNVAFRFYCFELMQEISENGIYIPQAYKGSLKGAIMIGFLGFLFVLTGFNVVLYDVIAGFLLKPFWYGLLVVSVAKFTAKYIGFCLGRYWFRQFIYKAMNENIYFITCYLAAEKKPVKLMFSVQFMTIPTLFKSYACGLFRISHWQFSYPTMFGTVVWVAFWVYVGNQLESIIGVLKSGDTSSFVPWWIKATMVIVIVVIVIYFFHVTKNIYDDIKNYADLDKLSEIIEREEQEEALSIAQHEHNLNI